MLVTALLIKVFHSVLWTSLGDLRLLRLIHSYTCNGLMSPGESYTWSTYLVGRLKKILPKSAQRSCKVALEFTLPSITHKKLNFPTVDENGWMGFSCRPSLSFCYPCHCCCCCHQCCSYWAKWSLWSILMGQTPCIGHRCMEAGRGGLVLGRWPPMGWEQLCRLRRGWAKVQTSKRRLNRRAAAHYKKKRFQGCTEMGFQVTCPSRVAALILTLFSLAR